MDAFRTSGYGDVRPSVTRSVLVPLFEEDGLRMGELAARSHLAKQTMTTMVRAVDAPASWSDGLIPRTPGRLACTSRHKGFGFDPSPPGRWHASNTKSKRASVTVELLPSVPLSPK